MIDLVLHQIYSTHTITIDHQLILFNLQIIKQSLKPNTLFYSICHDHIFSFYYQQSYSRLQSWAPTHRCLRNVKTYSVIDQHLSKISCIIGVNILYNLAYHWYPYQIPIQHLPYLWCKNPFHRFPMIPTRIVHIPTHHADGFWQIEPLTHHSIHQATNYIGIWYVRHILMFFNCSRRYNSSKFKVRSQRYTYGLCIIIDIELLKYLLLLDLSSRTRKITVSSIYRLLIYYLCFS